MGERAVQCRLHHRRTRKSPGEDHGPDQIPRQQQHPEPDQLFERVAIATLQKRNHRHQRVLGEELAPSHDHEDEAQRIRGGRCCSAIGAGSLMLSCI